MISELLIVIDATPVGRVRADRAGRLALEYEDSWWQSPQGYSLSVTMPRSKSTYGHKLVSPYLWNLLPENPAVLRRWSQQYHVSAANPFKLLAYVGTDVPGAAQLIPPDQLEKIQQEKKPSIDW